MQPGTSIAQYEIIARIGAGGMGEVYRARDTRLGREVAIKSVPQDVQDDPKALARFRREARILASVSHTNIAAIYGLEEQDGQPFLIMELVPGRTLAEVLAGGPMDVASALPIASQVAQAMAAAHGHGVVHRDLKPANVMVRPDGACKVLDFGLAKTSVVEGPPQQGLTSAGTILGTAPYMSPEQVRGLDVDERSDVWAYGVLLIEMLTGRNPFHARTSADTISAILNLNPNPATLPALHPAALELIGRCLVKDHAQRLSDFGQAVELLDRARQGGTHSVGKAPSAWSATPSPAGRATGPLSGGLSGSGAVLRTLVVSDLVGSTSLVEQLGDQRAAQVMALHDQVARELLPVREGREIDKTDGFLLLFERPIQGVLYALDYHRALAELSEAEGVVLKARVGIHLGEVILRANSAQAVSLGAKPLEVEGLAKPTAARLMSAGMGGQTLLTRGAYDLALRGSVGEPDAQGLQWLHHGAYAFQGVDVPVEVFEVGRGTAPLAPPPDSAKVRRTASGALSGALTAPMQAPPASRAPLWGGLALVVVALIAIGAVAWSQRGPAPSAHQAPAELFQIRSIVAVPSEVHGGPDDQHLGEAVSRSLSGRLAKLPDLVVKAPPSASAIASMGSPASVAGAYDVDAMVTSMVQVAGTDLAIDVQIIATATQDLLWSETFEGSREAYLDLIRRVASGAGFAIQAARGDAERVALGVGHQGSAVELELRRAEFLWNRYNHQHRPEDFQAAKAAYEALWKADPTLVEAANNLGYLHVFRLEAEGREEDMATGRAWGARSRAVRPSGRGLALEGWGHVVDNEPIEALGVSLDAVNLDPEDQFALNTLAAAAAEYSYELGAAGMAHIRTVHPLYLYPPVNEAGMLLELGRPAEALALLDGVLAIEPEMVRAKSVKMSPLLALNRMDEARALQAELEAMPEGTLPAVLITGSALMVDLVARPEGVSEQLQAIETGILEGDLCSCVGLPAVLAQLGRLDELRHVLHAMAEASHGPPTDALLLNPAYAPVQGEEDYEKLVQLGIDEAREGLAVLEAARERGELPAYMEAPLERVRGVLAR